ncbi:phenolic glucoside malonyltransferase 2-like [Phragmites australis]|uniref:phenolic glucoside malonyltransferase 2-like n=1 Tax=Phragmites australis TaxID=29695 RepID=UPI002D7A3913|nr:phenolic glucoside malonyltransferase 2-like [Phragmites australis]
MSIKTRTASGAAASARRVKRCVTYRTRSCARHATARPAINGTRGKCHFFSPRKHLRPARTLNSLHSKNRTLLGASQLLIAVCCTRPMGEADVSGAAAVLVLAVSRVVPTPAPAEREGRVKLSFFDTPWVVLPPIQRVFLYELPGADEFPAVAKRLKESLAATLAQYLPLAGKLTYVAETGDVFVDCADDPGVAFVEAEGDMDVRRLAGDEAHDLPAFLALVPELDVKVLPAPVLSVQATQLRDGLALGLSVHHAVADGQAVWRFMRAWASASREGSPVTKTLGPPHYSRDAIHVPGGDEFAREMLKVVAPNLPVANAMNYDFGHRFRLARRTFYLAADDIRSLKRRIDALASAENAGGSETASSWKPVSTFVALSALGWTAFVLSKGLAAGDDTYLVFLADLRERLDPPVGDGYLGNCIKGCMATADAGELLGERGLLRAARAIQAAVAEMEAAPLAGTDRWMERMMKLPFARVANVAASPRFRVYEAADLGFGRPARVELVSMNHDGEMVLVGGRRNGEVQLSVSLDPARMDAFKAHVLAID